MASRSAGRGAAISRPRAPSTRGEAAPGEQREGARIAGVEAGADAARAPALGAHAQLVEEGAARPLAPALAGQGPDARAVAHVAGEADRGEPAALAQGGHRAVALLAQELLGDGGGLGG